MYRLISGNLTTPGFLEQAVRCLPSEIVNQAPSDRRRTAWLAGRMLLAHALSPSPLPAIICTTNGKPGFIKPVTHWFNLSHSGDNIMLLLSDEGEVGCDIESIRPRKNWEKIADKIFNATELARIKQVPDEHQLAQFWRIWTEKEAILKQRSGTVWQMAESDSSPPTLERQGCYISHTFHNQLSIAVCTPTPFNISPATVETYHW
ncbi:4'-phosphopantetheinyl transferase AcpT [Siccibacter turicensis]|uniref:4'-phosphopantetheinyl transferase AcpT n=1 Tax=Siccibacter turicensis TaxID=357233 RepID=UPI003B8489B5